MILYCRRNSQICLFDGRSLGNFNKGFSKNKINDIANKDHENDT